jgi:type II secretory pathway component PulK
MKTDSSIAHAPRKSRDGSAVLIILVLLTIMVVLAAANTATLNRLRQRVKIVDQRQTQRLARCSTNLLSAAGSATNQPNTK